MSKSSSSSSSSSSSFSGGTRSSSPGASVPLSANKRLIKILSLLESTHDAEALQALRTAQKILAQSQLTLAGLAERHAPAVPPPDLSPAYADILPLQAEINRYRAALEQALAERDEQAREVARLQSFLREKDSLKLFQRLREREDNVASLTRELRRLKDELFQLEHKVKQGAGPPRSPRTRRSQESSGQRASGGAGGSSGVSASGTREGSPAGVVAVRQWVELCALKSSSEAKDWVSVRSLYDMFLEGRVRFGSRRPASGGGGVPSPAELRLGQKEFCRILSEILCQEPLAGSRGLSSGKGFWVVSELSLGEEEFLGAQGIGKRRAAEQQPPSHVRGSRRKQSAS